MNDQAAILSHRIDTLIAETERFESELLAEGNTNAAQTATCFALELRLARRSLAVLLEPSPPFRPLASITGGRHHPLTVPHAGPA